ncbi:hypothetical protein [Pseudodesulfovibrio piezophilus]|uniref:Uncharacterized protein n=1 Tax=Pseudodesulfovibrio piezophilus (strain DSM 21447 / JCM 15486 / C1TLV30) TaxID=1322246 RepID=M1WRV5_PSEP2|nr:hypothetical protein [Pseudodesulfovibrio piezophilus]CCH48542.1 protein of unknown function [Pseudodesulfovibrio piezophilus C1TLV30]
MINPVDGSIFFTAAIPQQIARKDSSSLSQQGDTVTLSNDVTVKMRAQLDNAAMIRESNKKADAENSGSKWELSSGLKEGTFILKNGNEQTISIDGDSLEILEYNHGHLVKSITGSIAENGASFDTEYYDASGDLSQVIHTDIQELEGTQGWTQSSMERSVQWYDDGMLKGEMQDSMVLSTWNSSIHSDDEAMTRIKSLLQKGTDKVVPDVEALSTALTHQKHIASYHAEIREFGSNSQLAREVTLDHEGRYKQLSNRSYNDVGNMEARSTRELEHNTNVSVTVKDYDSDGNLIRDAQFRDKQQDKADDKSDGKQEQAVSVAWYAKGELIKQSYGTMSLSETETAQLGGRPNILDSLGVSTEQYLGKEPQSAVDLMNTNFLRSSSEPELFVEGLNRHIGANDYSVAADISSSGSPNQPYSISWTDEIYRDGEMVMRQKDTQEAHESSFFQRERALYFEKGHALTENESPGVLRKTSHVREDFKDGNLTGRQSMSMRESIDVGHGSDTLETHSVMVQGLEGQQVTTSITIDAGILELDTDADAAASGMASETELTLDAFRETTGSMNQEKNTKQAVNRVHFDYRKKWD